MAPIIRMTDDQRLALSARWGPIPYWSKDDEIAQHTFNARGETASANYNVATPDNGANWQIRAQVQFMFPK
jgi:putative SOS response-associated peptidase YedK